MDTPTSGKCRASAGFTLIELMLVILVMAILSVIALFANLEYTARTRTIELMLAAGGCRTVVSEAYVLGVSPPGAGNWGCERATPTTRHVASVAVDENGKISVVAQGFNNDAIDGQVLTLAPIIDGRAASVATDWGRRVAIWRCGGVDDGTTIPDRYLPSTCR